MFEVSFPPRWILAVAIVAHLRPILHLLNATAETGSGFGDRFQYPRDQDRSTIAYTVELGRVDEFDQAKACGEAYD
jgi:hypothetical protein